jgi:molybdopterin biosynthesis enzyme
VGIKMGLGQDMNNKTLTLRHFLPVKIKEGLAYPLEYHGSGHLSAYADANGILEIPEGVQTLKKNDLAYVRPI